MVPYENIFLGKVNSFVQLHVVIQMPVLLYIIFSARFTLGEDPAY